MARVYLVKYNGQNIWIPESGDCENSADAAAKVTGCKPGYNCFVSTRFTGDLTAEEYIAQQKATETTTTAPTTTQTTTQPTTSSTQTTTAKSTTTPTYTPSGLPEPTLAQTYNAPGWEGTLGVPGYVGGFVGLTPGTPEAEWNEYQAYLAFRQTPQGSAFPPAANINEYEQIKTAYTSGGGGGEPPPSGSRLSDEEGFDYKQWLLDYIERYRTGGGTTERQYYESPMYYPAFTDWIREQGDMSGALRQYVENQYPSLAAQYQYDVGHTTGYPSEEEAIAGAENVEKSFQSWLSEERPSLYQEYMGQRPYARGERYADYASTKRLVNW